jgi:catalase
MQLVSWRLLFGIVAVTAACAVALASPPRQPLQEHIPATESADTAALVQTFEKLVLYEYAHGMRPAPRDAHPKAQGCVRASFSVREGLPEELRYGAFTTATTYPAWIRYSNGSPTKQPDGIGDGRGMAIKVIGVTGPKLVADEASTQDFVMINFPVFFSANAHDYLDLSRSIVDNTQTHFVSTHPRDASILSAIAAHVTHDMFAETYFSMAPYTLGKRYMKFRALPVRCAGGPARPADASATPSDPNFLRARMARDLTMGSVCFELQIQLQTNAADQPIEDATVEWPEREAPFVNVADIVIPKQHFESAAQQTFCENLSYTPWHGSVDQRPVGGINRIRLAVYRASSLLRHNLDHAPTKEPTGNETF